MQLVKGAHSQDYFRPATVQEYVAWLGAYVARKGPITHVYDYPFARAQFLVALRDFTLDGECGAAARSILVPKGIKRLCGALGHNNLYYNNPFPTTLGDWVPVYSDPEFDRIPGVEEARVRTAAERRRWEGERQAMKRRYNSDLTAYTESGQELTPQGVHVAYTDEPVTVNVESGQVVLLPSSMPVRLTQEDAVTLAHRILAAAGEEINDA